jgi:IPT/TIG domain
VTDVHAPIRTRYIRTNAGTFSSLSGASATTGGSAIYDAKHRQFFVGNPFLNEIDVFDAAQEKKIGQIPLPLVWGMDISPYNGSLYAASFVGDIYQIDTATLTIIKRYASSSIGPSGYIATDVGVLSDGRLALLGGQAGIIGVDGAPSAAVWDPVTNSLDTGPSILGRPILAASICGVLSTTGMSVTNIGSFAVSGDRTRVLVASIDSDGTVCSYDPVAKQATVSGLYIGFVRELVPTPDGKRVFLTTNTDGVYVFDTKTLQVVGHLQGTDYTKLPAGATSAVMSLDGKTLYLVGELSGVVGAFDTTSLQQIGWVPAFAINGGLSTVSAAAIDETGLIVGPMEYGVGFIDAAAPTTGSASVAGNLAPVSPVAGPVAGGTQIQTGTNMGLQTPIPKVAQFYVGNALASGVSESQNSYSFLSINATTPPAADTTTADLTATYTDGTIAIAPEAFSYGPTILEVVPSAATAEGGQLGAIIGFAFGASATGIQVTVGGQYAPVTVLHTSAPYSPYPFPTEALQFTIPPGVAGSVVDVTLTTPTGSTTAKAAFHYAPPVQSYSRAANLQAGIYDARRDLYYFTDQTQIQVLSKTGGNWLSPIPLPNTTAKTQLLAISESPDGSKLAVSDFGGQAIYVLDPNNPTSAQRFTMPDNRLAPSGLAATNSGTIYFAAADIAGTGTPAFYKLTLSTGSIVSLGYAQGGDARDKFIRVLLSPDGGRAYTSIEGDSFWVNTSNDQINYSPSTSSGAGAAPDMAISADGSTVDIYGFLADSSLSAETAPAYIDWETWFPAGTYGQKLNRDGSILFQPLTDGIDMIARNTGHLLYRIQIPVTTANVYDPLVVANGTNTLAVITFSGVSFVDLSSLPIPAADTLPFPHAVYSEGSSLPDTQSGGIAKPQFVNSQPPTRSRTRLRQVSTPNPTTGAAW